MKVFKNVKAYLILLTVFILELSGQCAIPPSAVPVTWYENEVMMSPHPVSGQMVTRRSYDLKVSEGEAVLTEVQSIGWTFNVSPAGTVNTNWQTKIDWSVKRYARSGLTAFTLTNFVTGVSDVRSPNNIVWTYEQGGLGDTVNIDPPVLVGVLSTTNPGTVLPLEMPIVTRTTASSKWKIQNVSLDSVPYLIQFWCEAPATQTTGGNFSIDFALNKQVNVTYTFGPELALERFPQAGYFYRIEPFFNRIRPLNQAEIGVLGAVQISPLPVQGGTGDTGGVGTGAE